MNGLFIHLIKYHLLVLFTCKVSLKIRKLEENSYPYGMIRSEVFIAPALDVPDTLDGGDPIVGDEYLSDGL